MDYTKLSDDTLLSGIICNKCEVILPQHTVGEHLDKEYMKKLHNCDKKIVFTPKLLSAIATVQFHFGVEELIEIFGKEKYQDMGYKWVQSKHNFLNFWQLLDENNKGLFFEYLDKHVFYLKE